MKQKNWYWAIAGLAALILVVLIWRACSPASPNASGSAGQIMGAPIRTPASKPTWTSKTLSCPP